LVILWLFGIFFPFWYVVQRKIWQPRNQPKHWLLLLLHGVPKTIMVHHVLHVGLLLLLERLDDGPNDRRRLDLGRPVAGALLDHARLVGQLLVVDVLQMGLEVRLLFELLGAESALVPVLAL
jgi:hypothetical protein